MFLILTTIIEVIMGGHFLNKDVYKIRIYIKANKAVLAIIEAIKASKYNSTGASPSAAFNIAYY